VLARRKARTIVIVDSNYLNNRLLLAGLTFLVARKSRRTA
jgi:hypothetical protein